MTRPDLYDYIGMALAASVVALWVAHFVLPPLPPDPSRSETGPAQSLPLNPPR
jgi:hypothetical protein